MNELAINGGAPVRSRAYPAWPSGDDREIEAVTDVIRSGDWGGFPEPGRYGGRFEQAFAAYQGATHGILMANGTITMEVALKALGIGWGDEVIIPALTFAATAYAPIAAGALPVIVDVTSDTWMHRPRPGGGRDHAEDPGDHARAPWPSHGRHGSDHGDRREARPRRRRGLRARARTAVAGHAARAASATSARSATSPRRS